MTTLEKKEKRDAVLYASVKPTNKAWLEEKAKELNYSTVSEFVDALIERAKNAGQDSSN